MGRLGAALFLLVVSAMSISAAELPARKAGLWEIKTTASAGRSVQIQECVDAKTDQAMQAQVGSMPQRDCSKRDVQKSGDTTTIDSVCTVAGKTLDGARGYYRQFRQRLHDGDNQSERCPAGPAHHDHECQMAWPLRGGSEARRHDHAERHEDEFAGHAERHGPARSGRRAAGALIKRACAPAAPARRRAGLRRAKPRP